MVAKGRRFEEDEDGMECNEDDIELDRCREGDFRRVVEGLLGYHSEGPAPGVIGDVGEGIGPW